MEIPPVHNCIVQWDKGGKIYLNIFDTSSPCFFYLSAYEEDREPMDFRYTSYEEYIEKIYNNNSISIYIPTTATTIEEALQLHPELLI